MRYYIRVSKQAAQEILAHLENKAAIIHRTCEDSTHFLHVDIDNGEDLLRMFYAGIELAEQINNPKQWYYSETHL